MGLLGLILEMYVYCMCTRSRQLTDDTDTCKIQREKPRGQSWHAACSMAAASRGRRLHARTQCVVKLSTTERSRRLCPRTPSPPRGPGASSSWMEWKTKDDGRCRGGPGMFACSYSALLFNRIIVFSFIVFQHK